VAEGARLESVYTGNRIEGSNPSLSASPFILLYFPDTHTTIHTVFEQYGGFMGALLGREGP
jgi:hypothetical protein